MDTLLTDLSGPGPGEVLIVDDDPLCRHFVQLILELELGIHAVSASNGKDALDVLAERKVGLVITDFQMPQMTGRQLLGRIRELSPSTQVVVMSGSFEEYGESEYLIAEGATATISKRHLAYELIELMRRLRGIQRDEPPRNG